MIMKIWCLCGLDSGIWLEKWILKAAKTSGTRLGPTDVQMSGYIALKDWRGRGMGESLVLRFAFFPTVSWQTNQRIWKQHWRTYVGVIQSFQHSNFVPEFLHKCFICNPAQVNWFHRILQVIGRLGRSLKRPIRLQRFQTTTTIIDSFKGTSATGYRMHQIAHGPTGGCSLSVVGKRIP